MYTVALSQGKTVQEEAQVMHVISITDGMVLRYVYMCVCVCVGVCGCVWVCVCVCGCYNEPPGKC